ncbi:MAG TPA: hypothetical protein VFC47_10735 [Caulobacteraceae bacterium]|nr:hypothetical protein [Caulobacteraceae bacterium]
MGETDQAGRGVLESIDLSSLPEEQRKTAHAAMWAKIKTHDLADQAVLKPLIPPEGWFLKSKYGDKAATAAFLIVQHAENDPALMRETLREAGTPRGQGRGGRRPIRLDV